MVSGIAWLDTSAEEQRRSRELIALFSEKSTLDELGVGQIRDVFSNALFPGTSTIQTRARYLLIVPWCFRLAAERGRSGAALKERADAIQRGLIGVLQGLPDRTGVIGAQVGARVRNLPSTIYWSGLLTWGVLRRDVSQSELSGRRASLDGRDEFGARPVGDWHPTLPHPPDGFPGELPGGLELTSTEARWLQERIVDSAPGTLLAHLATTSQPPDPVSTHPWYDESTASLAGPAGGVLTDAHLFSLVMEGATRLYGLLVAEAYETAGYTTVVDPVARHRDGYQDWVVRVADLSWQLHAWDRNAFWNFVLDGNERITPRTRWFVDAWTQMVLDGTATTTADGENPARALVAERERAVKRSQARLSNPKLLGLWGGGITDGLDYRWPTVKTLITDIHKGLARA